MSRQVTVAEAKAKILLLLDLVGDGETIEITKQGRTIARLVPAHGPQSLRGSMTGIARTAASDEDLFDTGDRWSP